MMRWLLRFFGVSSLATMVFCGLIDLIASSDKVETIFRPLGTLWLNVHGQSLQSLHAALTANGPSWLWSSLLLPILSQPGIFVFGCLALIFLALALMIPRRDLRERGRLERPDDHDPRYDRRRH